MLSIPEVISTIITPVAALNKSNENKDKRQTKAESLFKQEIVKIDEWVGTTGRVTAKARRAFLEADERIKSSMVQEGYSLPVDMKLQDISDMESNLIGGEGTSLPWLDPDAEGTAIKEQKYEEKKKKKKEKKQRRKNGTTMSFGIPVLTIIFFWGR